MLKNYIKIAWKDLQRRKFFTFVSLFGISLTLMVLMVLTAFIDHIFSGNYPEVNRDKCLYVSYATMTSSKWGGSNNGASGFHFINKYVKQMKTPQKIAMASLVPKRVDAFYGDHRLKLFIKTIDANFWEIMAFDFLAGKPFNQQHLADGARVAVISEKTRKGYFGNRKEVLGESIEIGAAKYKIIGVVKGVPITQVLTSADIYIPYTTSTNLKENKDLTSNSGFGGILLANDASEFSAIQAEFSALLPKVELPEGWDGFESAAEPILESFIHSAVISREASTNHFYLFLGFFIFLFMSLPAINLMNINVSRIMERSSEIGVRKAFGATSSTLVFQFIIENIVITLIGGGIGVLLSIIAINYLNHSGFIPDLALVLNLKVLWISLLFCLFFGLMSGVLPAFRMSKVNVVHALKNGTA